MHQNQMWPVVENQKWVSLKNRRVNFKHRLKGKFFIGDKESDILAGIKVMAAHLF